MLSTNQLNAQAKLNEAWKIANTPGYPLQWDVKSPNAESRTTRSITAERVTEIGKSNLSTSTFYSDTIRAWNKAPSAIKQAKTLSQAKKEIKKFVKTLPV